MEEDGDAKSSWEALPDELWLQIMRYLAPYHITRLQQTSRHIQGICLDDKLWKSHCFESSPWYQSLISRRNVYGPFALAEEAQTEEVAEGSSITNSNGSARGVSQGGSARRLSHQHTQRLQDMSNWDLSFPNEKVSWYDEYIQREGPASVNWLETPRLSDRGLEAINEVRGVALFSPNDGDDGIGTKLAVAPLEDGSVCLWDINGTRGRQGGILDKSAANLLYDKRLGGKNEKLRSQKIDASIADRVSIDNYSNKAYFAVQCHLTEVDLNRLDVVSRGSFEWSITTLSPIHPDKPLVVGTSLGVHLYDFRTRSRAAHDTPERVDGVPSHGADVYRAIFDPKPLPLYAPLSQPTPTSILYLPQADSGSLVTDDIYVSGRFSNILHYDRRKFPAIVNSIHSGATINSLAALPYQFYSVEPEVRRGGEMTAERISAIKSQAGSTLIAGGLYNQKGSLEIYGLGSGDRPTDWGKTVVKSSTKNRTRVASSPLLSVANHGTKIVTSDGSGFLKWFERDGAVECRRLKIGHSGLEVGNTMFEQEPQLDDVARKIVSTETRHGRLRPNNDNILFWTGERLGLVSFTSEALYKEQDFLRVDANETGEDRARQEYSDQMREALERQADEVRFMSSLGKGTRSSFGL